MTLYDILPWLLSAQARRFLWQTMIYFGGIALVVVAWYACFYFAVGAAGLLIYGAVYWIPAFFVVWGILMIWKYARRLV